MAETIEGLPWDDVKATCIHLRACNALARTAVGPTGGIDCTNCDSFEPDQLTAGSEEIV